MEAKPVSVALAGSAAGNSGSGYAVEGGYDNGKRLIFQAFLRDFNELDYAKGHPPPML